MGTATPLPSWSRTPADRPAAVRAIKAAVRQRLRTLGRPVEDVFAALDARIDAAVREIAELRRSGAEVWPVIEYADIASGSVPPADLDAVHRRGCVVVRGHFDREQALGWDRQILDYVERNRFYETYRGPGDDFFASVDSKPEIYPVYWSPAQLEARQSGRMALVQHFLNTLWVSESEGVQWFEPDRDALYPDRIRRRPPGTTSSGLGLHIDAGTLDLWMTAQNQAAFRHLYDGEIERFDPWDASHRTTGPQFPGSTMCSAFRTFQGWTALSDMRHDQGVLHTIPIPEVMGRLLLRPFLDDVAEDDLCGVDVGRVFPVAERWHPRLLDAVSGIPDIRAGDSVWWHCDLVHGVAPVTNQDGWGNVMYIPAAPWCPRNERYAPTVAHSLATGSSPSDFPAEHYERDWIGRPGLDDLNDIGRRGLGLDV